MICVYPVGVPLAYLNTGETKRGASYEVFAPRPFFPGQAPSGTRRFWNGAACKEVSASYLWARVVRSPLSDTCLVVDATGAALGRGRAFADGFALSRPDATGAGGGSSRQLPAPDPPRDHFMTLLTG